MPKVDFSLEVFPPKTDKGLEKLWSVIDQYVELNPAFMSVTYGAGGSTREKTRDICKQISTKHENLKVAAHLTCVEATQDEINDIAREYYDHGIRHLVALRGDPPGHEGAYEPYPGGYPYALDLVQGLKNVGDFEISVAAYPETHQDAPSPTFDLSYLKQKMDAGATRAITQFFMDPEVFLRFRDRAYQAGIDTSKLVPGILPLINFARMTDFAKQCRVSVPQHLYDTFGDLAPGSEDYQQEALQFLTHQISTLVDNGVTSFHFYTLNETSLTYKICRYLQSTYS